MNIDYIKKYLKNLGFDLDMEEYEKTKRVLENCAKKDDIEGIENYMKQCQNCGGYALQIPVCIFSGCNYTFEEQVLRITELYPFVRLLSDTKLKENEYLVKFRSGKTGHHFMRIDKSGNTTDKCECNLPGKFEGWGTLEDAPEAVFAVVKQEYRNEKIKDLPQCNRDMFLDEDAYYEIEEDGYRDIRKIKASKPITFRDKLQEAYNNRNSSFLYQGKTFYLKINKNDSELINICDDSEVLGELCTDGNEFIIELNDKKRNQIFGFQPNKPLEIKHNKEDNCLEL